ncbi:unnamed protein product [marine sediment metagenome]|uniref:Uncharacterized protein n=1 Tax=marine sediment metagenome TaxID=412755 RepID=X1DQD1_9ZZZZ
MIRNKRFWGNYKGQKDRKSQLVILMCIGLVAMVALAINIQLASADPTETVYCDSEGCHVNDYPTTWILLTVDSQTEQSRGKGHIYLVHLNDF